MRLCRVRPAGGALLLAGILALLACTTIPRAPRAAAAGLSPDEEELDFPGTRCADLAELRFYFTGDTFLRRAEELIRNARDYILIDSFLVNEDEKGRYIFELLHARMAQGVRVYLLTDASSGFVPGRTGIPFLVRMGIPVAEFNPMRGSRLARLPLFVYRDHRKFWIVDGEKVVLGGQNIWTPSLAAPEQSGNTDSMVEFRSATACRELVEAFVREWNAYSMDKLRVSDFEVRQGPGHGDSRAWLIHQDGQAVARQMFGRLFDLAHEEIWLIQDYTMPDRTVLERIRRLSKAGVRVNILFSGAYSFLDKFHYATGFRKQALIRAGAHLWEYEHPLSHLHYKGIIVDGHWFGIGSMNFNFRSAWLAKEVNLVLEGSDQGEPMLENLAFLTSHSRPITEADAAGYRGAKYFLYYLLLFLGG
jgi:cardiolipin synthase